MNTVSVPVSELTGPALDWAVAKCEGWEEMDRVLNVLRRVNLRGVAEYEQPRKYSTDWSQGGPIIERERISTDWDHNCWNASVGDYGGYCSGTTPLIAAMRCYVASKLGSAVDIPTELVI